MPHEQSPTLSVYEAQPIAEQVLSAIQDTPVEKYPNGFLMLDLVPSGHDVVDLDQLTRQGKDQAASFEAADTALQLVYLSLAGSEKLSVMDGMGTKTDYWSFKLPTTGQELYVMEMRFDATQLEADARLITATVMAGKPTEMKQLEQNRRYPIASSFPALMKQIEEANNG
ncbi:hypothetical protein H7Y63_03780 [Polaromonas sp.]|nr:hypothetical protein [Candidatus Saccharibacteria bacterium]